MKITTFGNRTESPTYFDFSNQYPEGHGPLRAGDRAACYIMCLEWRLENPDKKLIVYDDPHFADDYLLGPCEISPRWMLKDIADELVETSYEGEKLPEPKGDIIYNWGLWNYWNELKKRGTQRLWEKNTLTLPQENQDRVSKILKEWGIKNKYITIQPLFDAVYHTSRNIQPPFWNFLIEHLTQVAPVVVLAPPVIGKHITLVKGSFGLWTQTSSIVDSMVAASKSMLYVGGETGTTVWNAIFKAPTLALMPNVVYKHNDWCAEPLSFGNEVHLIKRLEQNLAFTINVISRMTAINPQNNWIGSCNVSHVPDGPNNVLLCESKMPPDPQEAKLINPPV